MSPLAHWRRLMPGRISGATTRYAAVGFARLTAWLTNASIERVIAARSALLSFGAAAAGAANASATIAAARTLISPFRVAIARAGSTVADDGPAPAPLAPHQLRGTSLEVQPQERLGVRRPDVHVPVVGIDGDSVEMAHPPFGAEAVLDLLELARHIGDGRVQLARDEVALAEGPQDRGESFALLGDPLEHEQERHDARVGLREVPEVVVARDLAAERGVLLAHAVLDERVPDAVHERHAAGALDRLGPGPARPDVVDQLRPCLLLEHALGEERRREVAGHELAGVVDEEAAVGVAVERNAEVGLLVERLRHDELAVLGQQRVRLVVREGAVWLEEAAHRLELGQLLEHGRQHRAGHAVRGVDHDLERLDRLRVDEREDALDVLLPDVVRLDRAPRTGPGSGPGHGPVADLEQPGLPADGQRARADDLQSRVLLRVVRGGDREAAVEPELADREIDHLRAHEAKLEPVCARLGSAANGGLGHRGRRDPHVVPDGDPLRLKDLDEGPADRVRALLVELVPVDPADVVCLEDLRIEHGRMLRNERGRPGSRPLDAASLWALVDARVHRPIGQGNSRLRERERGGQRRVTRVDRQPDERAEHGRRGQECRGWVGARTGAVVAVVAGARPALHSVGKIAGRHLDVVEVDEAAVELLMSASCGRGVRRIGALVEEDREARYRQVAHGYAGQAGDRRRGARLLVVAPAVAGGAGLRLLRVRGRVAAEEHRVGVPHRVLQVDVPAWGARTAVPVLAMVPREAGQVAKRKS